MSRAMSTDAIAAWLLEPSTSALAPEVLLAELVVRVRASGLSLARVSVWIPTKHPELWGHQLVWDPASGARVVRREHDVSGTPDYIGTPAEELHRTGAPSLRCRLTHEPDRSRFAMLRALADAGATDYLLVSFEPGSDRASWISFVTDREGGFDDAQLALLGGLGPLLSLHVRLIAAHFATQSLLDVYLGTNASRRVLDGAFRRGTGTALRAALWFCDMRDFTTIGDRLPAREVVRILDAYFEHVAAPIEENGGEILKFIGDAALAVFPIGEDGAREPCARALAAAEGVLDAIGAWSSAQPAPIGIGVALHVGEVMYGNIGGRARLDFTVIGAAVNEVCRVESLCKTLGTPLLMTAAFAGAIDRDDIVSLGRHALRGVSDPQEVLALRARS